MMDEHKGKQEDEGLFSRIENIAGRIFAILLFSLLGFVAGVLTRFFVLPTTFDSVGSLAWQYLPWAATGAVIFGGIALKYHRFAVLATCFIPSCEFS
ncbi:MAG: hypothetical protein CMF25_00220 [Kangiellaceae bacterium]|nr:hypothetical protein [Kangiellaceae bacterium]|tara:strand:- start:1314 stop:1604 length:291 start_codon:yes stop_codon:yes gene_type:complete